MVVLLVDDDADDREFFKIALDEVDMSTILLTASSAKEGLLLLTEGQKVDMVFLDLNMPHMDGRGFLKKIKADPDTHHIPVIIFTTSSHPRDMEETAALGASDFITKPSRVVELIDTLSYFFKTSNK